MVDISTDVDGAEEVASALQNATMEDEVTYSVRTPVHYALYQEVGTRFHPPQPFMRPAQRATETEIIFHAQRAKSLDDLMDRLATNLRDGAKRRAPVRTGRLRESIHKTRLGS